MGAVLTMPWTRMASWPTGLHEIAQDGVEVVALTPREDAQPLADLAADPPDRLALLLGSEGHGLSRQALEVVTHHVRIPMAGEIDSLNVAAAAAIACYALRPFSGRDVP
jgi:tRNA G18 (ribose-2'-O)-methylase SpoU